MSNEYYAVVRTGNEFAHYGVKGMRWGVRKALATGNRKALDRHFRKAAKKLKKLEDLGVNSKKYAAKAAAYGAAAAGTGSIVVRGSKPLVSALHNAGSLLTKNSKVKAGLHTHFAAIDLQQWANKDSSFNSPIRSGKKLKNDSLVKIGAGIATVGLGAAAARNAYKATHGAKYRQKAHEFRKAMNETFSGTPYAYRYDVPRKRKRKKK